MNLKNIIIVILRLSALNFLLQAIIKIIPTVLQMCISLKDAPLMQKVAPWSLIIIFTVLTLVFWFLAVPIANLISKNMSDEKLNIGSLDLVDCYTLVFIGIGLFYTIGYMANSFSWLHYIFKLAVSSSGGAWKQEVDWYGALESIIPFIVGGILVLKSKLWAGRLIKLHNKMNSERKNSE